MNITNLCTRALFRTLIVATIVGAGVPIANAHPYASGVTNDNGTIRFTINEGGGTVYVVFEDGTTNNSFGVLPRGATNFSLGSHTSYSIYVAKTGNGTPAQTSTDSDQWASYANPRGVSVNQNPKSSVFGRIYTGSTGTGGFAFGTPDSNRRASFGLTPTIPAAREVPTRRRLRLQFSAAAGHSESAFVRMTIC